MNYINKMVYLNQQSELYRKQINRQVWDFCVKYSNLFERNIDNKNLNIIVQDSYKNFISNIKSIKLQITDKSKCMRIWKTLINTIENNGDIDSTRIATKRFNYVIHINSLKNN